MTSAGRDKAVICRVERLLCALRASDVLETMRPLPVRPLAAMPSFVRGLAVIRGVPVPVIDAAALLGGSDEGGRDGGIAARFVALRAGARSVVLSVAAVLGVREMSEVSLQDLPPLFEQKSHEAVAAVGALDAECLVVLRAARILPEAIWEALERPGAAT